MLWQKYLNVKYGIYFPNIPWTIKNNFKVLFPVSYYSLFKAEKNGPACPVVRHFAEAGSILHASHGGAEPNIHNSSRQKNACYIMKQDSYFCDK